MESLRKIVGASRGSDSKLGDIKHKFKFHSDCLGPNCTDLMYANVLMANREI